MFKSIRIPVQVVGEGLERENPNGGIIGNPPVKIVSAWELSVIEIEDTFRLFIFKERPL